MTRRIMVNVMAALVVLGSILLADVVHVHVHPMPQSWWLWVGLALAYAVFCFANRGILKGRRPLARCAVIALLSAPLALAAFYVSFMVTLMYVHSAIGGTH